ncbi:MAG: hypothetical protein WC222_01845 [Parachlamydiales bacterium]|jgi:hypothetical protein
MLRCLLWVFLVGVLCSAAPHHTTAFLGAPGQVEIVPSVSYYSAHSFWNSKGRRLPAYENFRKENAQLYLEYAVNQHNSLWVQGKYERVHEALNHEGQAFGDPELGWKHQFYLCRDTALTGQITAILPYNRQKPSIRYGCAGAEATIIYSSLFNFWYSSGWYDLSAGYRYYFGSPSDIIRGEAAIGYLLLPNLVILAEGKLDYGMNAKRKSFKDNYLAYNRGYRLAQGQAELRWEVFSQSWIILGIFQNIWGRNVGTGGGGYGGAWITF